MKKKITSMLLIFGLIITSVGCSSNKDDLKTGANLESQETATEKPTTKELLRENKELVDAVLNFMVECKERKLELTQEGVGNYSNEEDLIEKSKDIIAQINEFIIKSEDSKLSSELIEENKLLKANYINFNKRFSIDSDTSETWAENSQQSADSWNATYESVEKIKVLIEE